MDTIASYIFNSRVTAVLAEQFHTHGLHWGCCWCVEAWYGDCTEGCGPYQTLTPVVVAGVVAV